MAYTSFLAFTMWANLAHALIMAGQATMMPERYGSKWFTDIPFTGLIALGIYLRQPQVRKDETRTDRSSLHLESTDA